MWFILVPILVYLGVGVLAYLVLIVLIIREGGLTAVVDAAYILDTFKFAGIYEGVKEICSSLFSFFVLTIICVLGVPAILGIGCLIAILSPEFRREHEPIDTSVDSKNYTAAC